MYHRSRPLFLYCETPLHAGSGSELGVIDLPIQRERHTDFPKIEGSSLKGALRERFEQKVPKDKVKDIFLTFGPEGNEGLYAGALGFTDARLLLFPVKSMKGIFAWVTCAQVLKRFLQDMHISDKEVEVKASDVPTPGQGKAYVSSNSELIVANDAIVLEEYSFTSEKQEVVSELAQWFMENLFTENSWWQQKIGNSLVVLSDDDFRDFVNLSTEVITRVKIDNETGTVADGALFTEEYLPAESILYSLVLAAPVFPVKKKAGDDDEDNRHKLSSKASNEESNAEAVMSFFGEIIQQKAKNRVQAGANATLGKGLIRTTFLN